MAAVSFYLRTPTGVSSKQFTYSYVRRRAFFTDWRGRLLSRAANGRLIYRTVGCNVGRLLLQGYANILLKAYLFEDRPLGGGAPPNSNGESRDGSDAPEHPRYESDYAPLVEVRPPLPLVYPPTRWKRKDRPTRLCIAHGASVLYNAPTNWPSNPPPQAKFPHQAVKPLKALGNMSPPMRPNTIPPSAKFPPHVVEKSKAPDSKPPLQCEVSAPWRKYGGYATQTSVPFHRRVFISDWGRNLRIGLHRLRHRRAPGDSGRKRCRRPTVGRYNSLVFTKRTNARYVTRSSPQHWPVPTLTRFGLLTDGQAQLPTNC